VGLWQWFQELIFQALFLIEGVVGDWGLAIIILTVFIRLLLMPLTMKQTKSMYELQRVQPKLKELQKKYKDDKQKQQEEVLKFYQENKVNPLGGCLPMILQMPVFFALFRVLGGTAENPGLLMEHLADAGAVGQFYFLIPDISKAPKEVYTIEGLYAAIPYLILVVLFAVSIWLPQQLMPGERQQKLIGAYMAVVMLYFGWISPAGVLLYWVTSSAWGIAQQQIMLRMYKESEQGALEGKGTSEAVGGKKAKSKKVDAAGTPEKALTSAENPSKRGGKKKR
jgi:YidC/Oxa1 family membrane protein insertase